MIIVSACLLGVKCKYSGDPNINKAIIELFKQGKLIPICPEQLGGLKTPRLPAEIVGDKVIRADYKDVTNNFKKGAEESLRIAKLINEKKAILKENSPSCGSHYIYDGNFNGKLIKGKGITCRLLEENGIEVFSERENHLIQNELDDL